jgi:hypothetical protein
MEKRKYKQYLSNPNLNMPSSTYYSKYSKKYKFNQRLNETTQVLNENIDQLNENSSNNELNDNHLDSLNENQNFEVNSNENTTNNELNNEEQLTQNQSSETNDLNNFLNNDSITEEELAAAYLAAFYNGRVTQKSLTDFLTLSNINSTIKLPNNYSGLISLLNSKNKELQFEKSWFCGVCQKQYDKLDNRFQRLCATCKTTRLTMYYHLNIENQIQNIMNKVKLKDFEKIKISDDLTDITDGRIYKQLLASEDGHLFEKKLAFSFSLNTDGISISNKSKLTIWPVFLVINELPLNIRFSIDNVILAGLSVGSEKPNIDIFFNPIVIKLKKLEIGVNISIENITRDTKFFLISSVFDKPAKSAILNMISCNGFFGCTKCLQKAQSFKTNELKFFLNEKETTESIETPESTGSTRLYLFNNDWNNKRTEKSYDEDLKQVKNNIAAKLKETSVNGIKGPCILSCLKHFHPIRSTCIDYMHSVLEGVIKNFFKYWFSSEFTKAPFSLRKYMKEIDHRLSLIMPPRFVPSTPRSIYEYNLWSAHEYLSFIMYYAVPVFTDVMSHEHYENIKKLILFLETILSQEINVNHLLKVEKFLIQFVSELESLYTKSIMLSGVHELLHLTECTLDFGPLNSTNCFQYEEMNRKLVGFLHGFDLIGEELIKIFLGAQVLSSFSNNVNNQELKAYIKSRIGFKTSNLKRLKGSIDSISIRTKSTLSSETEYLKSYEKYFNTKINEISIFYKINFNGINFTSHLHKTKRCDACFVSNNKFGLIECFFIHNDKVYVLAKQIVSLVNSFYSSSSPEIGSNLFYCYISNNFFIHAVEDITKTVIINLVNDRCFISLFKSSHLFS